MKFTAFLGLNKNMFFRILPESPRWLISKGRTKEAEVVMGQMAIINRRPITDMNCEEFASADTKEVCLKASAISNCLECKNWKFVVTSQLYKW